MVIFLTASNQHGGYNHDAVTEVYLLLAWKLMTAFSLLGSVAAWKFQLEIVSPEIHQSDFPLKAFWLIFSITIHMFLNSFLLLVVLLLRLGYLMPGGYIPRLEIMERECWKFLDWRLNSDNDSRLHGQPSSSLHPLTVVLAHYLVSRYVRALVKDLMSRSRVFSFVTAAFQELFFVTAASKRKDRALEPSGNVWELQDLFHRDQSVFPAARNEFFFVVPRLIGRCQGSFFLAVTEIDSQEP